MVTILTGQPLLGFSGLPGTILTRRLMRRGGGGTRGRGCQGPSPERRGAHQMRRVPLEREINRPTPLVETAVAAIAS